MYTLTITQIEKQHSIPDGVDYLDVSFQITAEGDTVYEGRHAFPLDMPEDDIKRDLTKVLNTFAGEQARAESNAKVEATHKQADKTIESLTNLGIHAEID